MSGLAAIYQRDNAPVSPDVFACVMDTLGYRGPDGHRTALGSEVALGHHHFWTTPEEVGEYQPIYNSDLRLALVFDGRLDNRGDLLNLLGLAESGSDQLSDATLVMHAYHRWGEACFARFLGPFALIIHDQRHQRVICARDVLGARSLFYHINDRLLVIASEEAAVLAHPAVSDRMNESAIAHFFALQPPILGTTFYSDINELPPAHAMVIDRERLHTWRYWQPDPERRIFYRSESDYAEHYLSLLEDAVRCRMRAPRPLAVMMSGGLDSCSVTALSARNIEEEGNPAELIAISWVFDELEACDERAYMDTIIDRYALEVERFLGDDFWPLKCPGSLPMNPAAPDSNAYRSLIDKAMESAYSRGARVVLTGSYGDHLYTGRDEWLLDLMLEERYGSVLRTLWRRATTQGLRQLASSRDVRLVGRRALERLSLRPDDKHDVQRLTPVWLTKEAKAMLADDTVQLSKADRARRADQFDRLFNPAGAWGRSNSIFYANRMGVEVRHPYRDRRLMEYIASIPAHQLYRDGLNKYILRKAMSGLLPEKISNRISPTSLKPLFRRGLADREKRTAQTTLHHPDTTWHHYVQREWLENVAIIETDRGVDGPFPLIHWLCISFELWRSGFRQANSRVNAHGNLKENPHGTKESN